MADFTSQQKAILTSSARNNLIHAVARTGKTTVLARKYLNQQQRPGAPRAVFLTANALATTQVLGHLRRITTANWRDDLIGTFAEIGCKLVKRYHRELAYTAPPEIVSDFAVANEHEIARATASVIHPDQSSAVFHEQCNQALVQGLRRKNLATPHSLTVEAINLLTKVLQPELADLRLLLADNVHDFGFTELLGLSVLQERMEQSFLAGNINAAVGDRRQDLDPESWLTLVNQAGMKVHHLTQLFGVGNAQGMFLQQLAAYNSKRIYETSSARHDNSGDSNLWEIAVSSRQEMWQAILDLEDHLQLGARQRLLTVVLRNPNDTRECARVLGKRCFLQWDKHRLWHQPGIPEHGIICTTPFETAYLNPDYVVLPNCLNGYWPYPRERHLENCRRAFLRAVASARRGVFFLVPFPDHTLLPSPFLAEGCTPKLVTKALTMRAGKKPAFATA